MVLRAKSSKTKQQLSFPCQKTSVRGEKKSLFWSCSPTYNRTSMCPSTKPGLRVTETDRGFDVCILGQVCLQSLPVYWQRDYLGGRLGWGLGKDTQAFYLKSKRNGQMERSWTWVMVTVLGKDFNVSIKYEYLQAANTRDRKNSNTKLYAYANLAWNCFMNLFFIANRIFIQHKINTVKYYKEKFSDVSEFNFSTWFLFS